MLWLLLQEAIFVYDNSAANNESKITTELKKPLGYLVAFPEKTNIAVIRIQVVY